MTPIRMLRCLILAAPGSLAIAPAMAQDASYYYGGVSVGQSRSNIDDGRITAGLLGAGLNTTSLSVDERSVGYRIFGGYQFNPYVALEGGYFNLGRFGYSAATLPAGTLAGQIRLQGFNLDLVGTLPVTERFSVIGRVGAQVAKARDSFSGTGAVQVLDTSPEKTDTNYKLGVGLQYAFSPQFLVRGEAERYRVNDAIGNHGDVDLFSIALVFPLGRTAAPVVRPAPVSSYVAPVPVAPLAQAAPMPPPMPAAAPPARQRVSLSADSLFAFDQSAIQPAGRAALDGFVLQLGGVQYDVISIEGHTDRLGPADYNKNLSLRRAEAVKGYLITGGVDANRLSATGKGESEPVTRAADCKGSTRTRALIACLQPDRRVVLEATGLR